MRSRTVGFVGSRLIEARKVRGFTAVALAEIIENRVSTQAISQYENGKSSPTPEVLRALAAAVNLPEHFFLRPQSEASQGTVFYRSMAAATKSARARAEGKHKWLKEVVAYLSEFVDLPASNFPVLNLPDDPLLLSDDEVEDAAESVRRFWNLQEAPIANMILLLENHGAIVARDRLGAETLDGLSEFVAEDQRPYIIIGTDKGTPVRWRFDAAHELGHIILHSKVPPHRLVKKEHFRRIEEQAHRFAAAFLLPLAPFGEDLFAANLDTFVSLKPKWKTSVAMMITRAQRAGFISEDTTRRLWINYSRRGWKRSEPYDDTMDPEQPRLLRRSFELILENGAQTPEDVVARLALSLSDVERLCGIPNGFLSNFAPVTLRAATASEHDPTATPANVISLPLKTRKS